MNRHLCFLATLLALWVVCPCLRADYLEVRRPAQIKAKPARDAETISKVKPKLYLELASTTQRNGYYRVATQAGQQGWIYRALVRRFPGQMPDPEIDEEEDLSQDEGTADGSTDGSAEPDDERVFDEYQPHDPSGKYFVHGGLPDASKYGHAVTILKNAGYVVGFCADRKNPAWAGYRAFKVPLRKSDDRPSRFKTDHRVADPVTHDDYNDITDEYDRGHMAPSAAISLCYGRAAQLETFLMTNICPQTIAANRGISRRLEDKILKQYATNRKEVWVLVGPIYDGDVEMLTCGVEMPDSFFMIILDEDNETGDLDVLAFEFPQEVDGKAPLESFLTSVDQIEKKSQLNFFAELPDGQEQKLEAHLPSELW